MNAGSAGSEELSPVEVLAEEFLERQQRGEKPTIREYCEKHPELAEEIREVFEALAMMEELKPDSHDVTGTFGSGIQTDGKRLERVGDYRILREIGRGGMGVVYEAEQESLRRRVALKVLPRRVAGDEKALIRFQREARAAARMHHTNIVPVFDVGEDDEHVFYAMQMIHGQGLDLVVDDLKRLRTEHVAIRQDASADRAFAQQELEERQSIAASLVTGKFHQENLVAEARREEAGEDHSRGSLVVASPEKPGAYAETILQDSGSTASAVLPGQSQLSTAETNRNAYFHSVAEIGLQTARALSYAHARGIIHRDIKPSNLLLDAAGVVWVTDFGLAKTSDEAMTHTGDILGTIRYMSPERFKGQCDVRADVYSLGLTLYELLTLRPAFSSPDRLRLIEMVSSTEPPTPRSLDPRVPRDLETILLKSIDKDPRRRYQSADEMCEDLERFIQDEPIKARRISYVERLARWSRRNKPLAASLAVVAALVLIVAVGSTIAAGHFRGLNKTLETTLAALAEEKSNVEEQSLRNAAIARERDLAARNEAFAADEARTARDEIAEQQELTRRNLYDVEIGMAHLAGLTGDMARREELLRHWQTTNPDADLRGLEYYLLAAELHDDFLEIRTNSRSVPVVAWSPDGTRIAMGDNAGGIHICNSQTGKVVDVLAGHLAGVFGLDWSPDGSRLVSSSGDGTVRIWDIEASQELLEIRVSSALVLRVAWASDGRRVASASFDGTARVWDAGTGEQLASFGSNASQVFDVAWHPEGSRVASVGDDRVVHVWDATTGEEIESFAGHAQTVFAVTWAPDGQRLASTENSGECFIWRSGQPEPITRLEHKEGFSWVDWSDDGRWLAVSDSRNAIRIHDPETGEEVVRFRGHAGWQSYIAWSPDSRWLASSSGDGSVRIWQVDDVDDAPRIATGSDRITSSDWSLDGRFLVTGDVGGRVRLWDAQSRELIREFTIPEGGLVYVEAVRISPDGALLAVAGRPQNDVLVWDLHSADLVQRLQGPALERINQYSGSRSLAWADDRNLLAVGNSDGDILLWDSRSWELIDTLESNSGINDLCFLPETEGGWLIAGQQNHHVKVWDVGRRKVTQNLDLGVAVQAVDVNRSGMQVAVGGGARGDEIRSGYGVVRVWNAHNSGGTFELQEHLDLNGVRDVVQSLQYTADGKRLLAGGLGGAVHLWDLTGDLTVDRRRQLLVLDPEMVDVETVRVTRDGIRLAGAGSDGNIRIWDGIDGYTREFSPLLLPMLERKLMAGTATSEDCLLRARILARQGNWSAAAAGFDRLFELSDSERWYVSDLWVLDGPFPGELETEYPPEQMAGVRDFDVLDPIAGNEDEEDPVQLHWQPREFPPNTLLDFGAVLGNRIDVTGYALLRVYVARDERAGLLLGADDQHRLWLNGELIHEGRTHNGASPDEHAVPVELQRGWNTLLAKVTNALGFHGLYLSLSDDPGVLAPAYARSGEINAAAEMWDRAVEVNPDSAVTLLNRAQFLWRQGQYDAAERDFDRAIEIAGDAIGVWVNRAGIFARLGRVDDAVADLDRAVELNAGAPALLLQRGNQKVRLGRFEDGAADFKEAIALNPTDHWNTYHLTSLLLKTGDVDGYLQLREDMLARWGESTDSAIAERTTKAALLCQVDDVTLGRLDALMEAAGNAEPQPRYFAHFLGARGMLEYRHGEAQLAKHDADGARQRFRTALNLLNQARSRGVGNLVGPHCDIYRAMALHHLGRAEQALRMLQSVEESLAGDEFTQPGERYEDNWHDEFMPWITYHEAARLIYGPAYDELLEGERLLVAGDPEAAIDHLEQAAALGSKSTWFWQQVLTLTEEQRLGYETLVPTSENADAVEWQYRFTEPSEGWMTEDSEWMSGPAPFGSDDNLFAPRTTWARSVPDIWIRTTFEVSQPVDGSLLLRVGIDDMAEIYINGVFAASSTWNRGKYEQLQVSPEAVRAIHPGTNLLSVHCHNNDFNSGGRSGIDVGLYREDVSVRERLLNAALNASPESPELLSQRSTVHVQRERWHDAAADAEQAATLNPDSTSIDWMKVVALHAMAVVEDDGGIEDYQRVCDEMIERYRDSETLADIERTMKCCLILPAETDIEQIPIGRVQNALAEEAVTGIFIPWFNIAAAIAELRRADADEAQRFAMQALDEVERITEAGQNLEARAIAEAVRGIALARGGQRKDAASAVAQARELVAGQLARHPDGALVGSSALNNNGQVRHDLLIAEILLREAEAALE